LQPCRGINLPQRHQPFEERWLRCLVGNKRRQGDCAWSRSFSQHETKHQRYIGSIFWRQMMEVTCEFDTRSTLTAYRARFSHAVSSRYKGTKTSKRTSIFFIASSVSAVIFDADKRFAVTTSLRLVSNS